MRVTRCLVYRYLLPGIVQLLGMSLAYADQEQLTTIQGGSKVSIEYTVTLADGTPVVSNVGKDPVVFEQGNGRLLPALERALLGLKVNETKVVTLSPADAFGPVDPRAFQAISPGKVPESSHKVGATLLAVGPRGDRLPVRVHEVNEDSILLDLNHPLAGKTVKFDVRILDIQ